MAIVLVVNDDNDLLDIYQELVVSMGHEPVTRPTITSGPAVIREIGADALIVDLQSPAEGEMGLRIIEEVRSHPDTSDIPIILCSGAPEAVEVHSSQLEAWRVPVVIKPFALEELETHLRSALSPAES
jgi:DNA-binding response OmpR family regulator